VVSWPCPEGDATAHGAEASPVPPLCRIVQYLLANRTLHPRQTFRVRPDVVGLRIAILAFFSASLMAFAPGSASAQRPAPCSNGIIHDWYADGRIGGQYRVSCYQAALRRVPNDVAIYGAVRADMSRALSSGINRVRQRGATVGPTTVLPAPKIFVASSFPASKAHDSTLRLVALAFLLFLLFVWCVARWRGPTSAS
jgi:hypothetical protein